MSAVRLAGLAALAGLGLLALWLGPGGGMQDAARWAAAGQREVQTAMAGALRGLRAGEAGALTALLGVSFAYGFFHAVGPGHGKIVVGGYGLAERVPLGRLAGIAVAGSLLQGASAVLLVGAGVWLLGATREQMTGWGDDWLAPASLAAIALVGLWLALRGGRRLARTARRSAPAPDHDHDHDHDHHGPGAVCETCGHAHGPDPAAVARASDLRTQAALVLAVGLRPCTGALFLLILGWRMDLVPQAVAGVMAMALGTASVTLAVAAASVTARESVLVGWGAGRGGQRLAALLELSAGLVVALVAAAALRAGL
jgi:ABC-type nickel/cobalt efflux system permease component RcnA